MFVKDLGKTLLDRTIVFIFFIAFFLFIGKWIFSYYFFDNEIGIRVIFENPGDGFFYFPYIKYLSSLNFNLSFDLDIKNLKNISVPLYGVLIHSIFFKILGNYSFIILEFIFISIFLIIFYLIFQKFNFSKLLSIILALFLFIIPILADSFKIDNILYLSNISDFYNLRFQRPLVVALFFFIFILFLLNLNEKEIFKFKNFIFLGSIFAFSFTAYYYYFVVEVIGFFLFLVYQSNYNIKYIFYGKIKFYVVTLFTFLILSFPFLLILYGVEPDYSERLCIVDLTLSRKIILLNHLIEGLIKIKFLFIFLIISFVTYFINKKELINYKLNNVFYIVFLSSIISPFFFIIASPITCLVYHFNNIIFHCAFLCLFFLILTLAKSFLSINFIKKKIIRRIYFTFIFSLVIFYNVKIFYDQKYNYENENYSDHRNYLNLVAKDINNLKIQEKDLSLLTFDPRLMIWAIMNNIKDIKLISGQIVPKTHSMIENDLISAFKFLNRTDDDFIKFFENKKSGWRYLNKNTQLFFWMRYSANSLKTHKDTKNFDKEALKFILNTSPLHAQSLIIPKNELERLKSKFNNFEKNDYKKPNIISINSKNFSLNEAKILNMNYCADKQFKKFTTYKLKNRKNLCKKSND